MTKEALPVKTERETKPDLVDFKEGNSPDQNFDILVNSIKDFNFKAGIQVAESHWYMGKLIHIFEDDKSKGSKIFGDHKFQEIGERVNIGAAKLDRWRRAYETWTLEEIKDLMSRGLSYSHFENLIGLATPQERRESIEKLLLPGGGVVPVNEMANVLPSASESKKRSGIKDGRGRPSKKDKARKVKEPVSEDGEDDPILFFEGLGERAAELKKEVAASVKILRIGEVKYKDDARSLSDLKKAVNSAAKKAESLAEAILKVFAKKEE